MREMWGKEKKHYHQAPAKGGTIVSFGGWDSASRTNQEVCRNTKRTVIPRKQQENELQAQKIKHDDISRRFKKGATRRRDKKRGILKRRCGRRKSGVKMRPPLQAS